jgi:diguanylate cyclase (GGDEF)-like protein
VALSIAVQHRWSNVSDLWWTSLVAITMAAWTGAVLPTGAVLVVCVTARLGDLIGSPGAVTLAEVADLGVQALVAIVIAGAVVSWRRAVLRYRATMRSDPGTGVLSSREFMRLVHAELERARRYDRPFSLACISMGSPSPRSLTVSEAAVRSAARVLTDSLRAPDSVARIGRVDLALLLPETSAGPARVLADRLFAALAARAGAGATSQLALRVRFGMVTWISGELGAEQLLQRAYQLMYDSEGDGSVAVSHEAIDSAELPMLRGTVPRT